MKSKKPKEKKTMGRPSEGLTETLYVRITPDLAEGLEAARKRIEAETGICLGKASLVRVLLTRGMATEGVAERVELVPADTSRLTDEELQMYVRLSEKLLAKGQEETEQKPEE
jgi:hypothetical protein